MERAVTLPADLVSAAVVVYSGFGTAEWPASDAIALEAEFGELAAVLAPMVHELVLEMLTIEVDWSRVRSLADASATARRTMAARHPELSDDALAALEWKYSFAWRNYPEAMRVAS